MPAGITRHPRFVEISGATIPSAIGLGIVPAQDLGGAFLALAVHLGAGRGKLEFNDNDLRLQLDDDIAATLEGMHFGIGNDADATQQH
jgi:hypothetical protein